MDAGLLVVRVVFGVLMTMHGAQKLFGSFGGHGIEGTGGFLESIGFRPGKTFAVAAGGSELVGGVLTSLGLFGPVGPALMLSVMIVAAGSVHWKNGLFASTNGIELALLYASAGVGLALTGPGRLSLDYALALPIVWTAAATWGVIAVAAAGGFANLALRHQAPVAAHA